MNEALLNSMGAQQWVPAVQNVIRLEGREGNEMEFGTEESFGLKRSNEEDTNAINLKKQKTDSTDSDLLTNEQLNQDFLCVSNMK